jgi:hypothetical protein
MKAGGEERSERKWERNEIYEMNIILSKRIDRDLFIATFTKESQLDSPAS